MILLLLALAAAGQGVRLWVDRPGSPPGDLQLLSATPAHSAAAQAALIHETFRPLAPGELVDVDRAPDRELARLPRVSLALARRIVADRQANGPFRALEGLDRVPGIGPRTLERLRPHVTFSGLSGRLLAGVADSLLHLLSDSLVRINLAGARELRALPGIGPARAKAILAWRGRHGFFTEASDLAEVPGVSANLIKTFEYRLDFTTP